MPLGLNFFLSLGSLLIGILGGAYFFFEWRNHRAHITALFWAIGLFCLFLFQIPTILFNKGVHFALTQFGLFFSIAVPVSFLSLIAIYCGIVSLRKPVPKRAYFLFSLWFAASLVFFNYFFYINQTFTSRLPLYALILLFFMPMHFLNLWALFTVTKASPDA